jgi:hypothetical protein
MPAQTFERLERIREAIVQVTPQVVAATEQYLPFYVTGKGIPHAGNDGMNSLRLQKTWSLPSLDEPIAVAKLSDPKPASRTKPEKMAARRSWNRQSQPLRRHVRRALRLPDAQPQARAWPGCLFRRAAGSSPRPCARTGPAWGSQLEPFPIHLRWLVVGKAGRLHEEAQDEATLCCTGCTGCIEHAVFAISHILKERIS